MKSNIKAVLTATFVAAILMGCATAGNSKIADASKESVSQMIVQGKTTKDEVQANLGDATNVTFTDAGNEVWTYKHARATPKAVNFVPVVNLISRGADVTTKELVVMFNEQGVVSKYTMREISETVNRGLAH